jgi:flagellar biosynthetic protein FliO
MDLVQQLAGVVLVLALLGALALFGKRRGFRSSSRPRRMEILERLPLSPQHSLHLVNIDGETVLVGVSPHGCQLLQGARERQ